MKKILSALAITIALVFIFNACKKVESLPMYENGKVVALTASKTAVTPALADTAIEVINFSWTSPKYASDSSTYKYIVEIDSSGRNFTKAVSKTVTGKLSTGFTGREINAIMLGYGLSLGVSYPLDVRVTSSYGNNNERYISNIVKVNATPFNDPSLLTSTQTTVTCALATNSLLSNTFNWGASFKGYSDSVYYTIQYDSAFKNFVAPINIVIGTGVVTGLTKSLTQGEMNAIAINSGIVGGTTGKVEYRLKATTALGAVSYSNIVFVTIQSYQPLLRFYMPGGYQAAQGLGNDWDPPTAPEMIRDIRAGALNNIYYSYTFLAANTEFKMTMGRAWLTSYGPSTGTTGTAGDLIVNGSNNFKITTSGVYRISVDFSTMKYDIRLGRMGFVGGAVPSNNWTPATTFTDVNSQMGYVKRDVFIGINDFAVDGWKMIDNNNWNNGNVDITNNRSFGSVGNGSGNGSTLEINSSNNMPNVAAAGRYRVIWDGTDPNDIKYQMNSATQMRVVGNGINQAGVNDWDPPTSPQMTYLGNGRWQIILALKANKEFKFLAGNAWGAFDYEDDGGTNINNRKIRWDGNANFSTPSTAGTYTIVLDEKNRTVTIN